MPATSGYTVWRHSQWSYSFPGWTDNRWNIQCSSQQHGAHISVLCYRTTLSDRSGDGHQPVSPTPLCTTQLLTSPSPSEENLVQFSKKAAGALANVDAGAATGGTVGEIPLAEAAFTPAEEEAPPAPSAPAPPAETPSSTPGAAAMEAHHRLGY